MMNSDDVLEIKTDLIILGIRFSRGSVARRISYCRFLIIMKLRPPIHYNALHDLNIDVRFTEDSELNNFFQSVNLNVCMV